MGLMLPTDADLVRSMTMARHVRCASAGSRHARSPKRDNRGAIALETRTMLKGINERAASFASVSWRFVLPITARRLEICSRGHAVYPRERG